MGLLKLKQLMKRHIKIKILSDKKTSTFLSLKTEAPEMLICPLSQIVCTAHYSVTQMKFVQVKLPFFFSFQDDTPLGHTQMTAMQIVQVIFLFWLLTISAMLSPFRE